MIYQLIEHESGWKYGTQNRDLDEFLNEPAKDFKFEIAAIIRVGPEKQSHRDSFSRGKENEYQVLIRTGGEFGGSEIPQDAIRKAAVSRPYDGDF